MYHYKCMNQIAKTGLDEFSRDYAQVEEMEEADALVVRSAALHDTEFPKNLKAIAGREQASIISPWENARKRASWSSTRRERTPTP